MIRSDHMPMTTTSQPPTADARRVALASAIGTTIEWYDFFIYGTAAATVFGPRFFPQVSPFVATLAAFATFGVGFLARPIGGVVMGHFGDRVGRKWAARRWRSACSRGTPPSASGRPDC
jgi:MFS family permease